jgi:hypothetical protein
MKIPYHQIDFTRAEKASDLPPYIGIDPDLFERIISSQSRNEFYFKHEIPKRGRKRWGQVRVVWEVNPSIGWLLAEPHKTFARRFDLFARIADSQFPHNAAYGYVRDRGTKDNARVHCGARWLLRADIKDFFDSISAKRLEIRFVELGLKRLTAIALAKFTTIDDRLALGLNGSPMLANLVSVRLDQKIEALALRSNCTYTRYADDISISGADCLPDRADLERILIDENFQLNGEKFRITKNGQAHYVTGLSISDTNQPHAPRHMKRLLRQELYYCQKYGLEEHLSRVQSEENSIQAGVNRIDGRVQYVCYHEPYFRRPLKKQWNKILERDGWEPNFKTHATRIGQIIRCYVDESEIPFGNKKYLALALVFTEDSDKIIAPTLSTLRAHQIEDPFYAGDAGPLADKGLHFADSHFDLRTAYLKVLSTLSYRAFVIYGELKSDSEYAAKYISLLKTILRDRLIWYDGARVDFEIEENSKLKLNAVRAAIEDLYKILEKSNSRRPVDIPKVTFNSKKSQPCFSVPDFMLGVFARYAKLDEAPNEESRKHQFERLRDKYRLIVDIDNNREYSRRRPFEPWHRQKN